MTLKKKEINKKKPREKRLSGSLFTAFATFWTQFVTERVGTNSL